MNTNLLHPSRKTNVPTFANAPRDFDPNQTIFLKQFGRLVLRPIRPEDEVRMIDFHRTLSEDCVYFRYFEHISFDTRVLHERLAKVCQNTPESFAIVAEKPGTGPRPASIVAVGRLTTTDTPFEAAFAILVGDDAQKAQFPLDLLHRLMEIARKYGFRTMTGELLVADHENVALCRDAGFTTHTILDEGIVQVTCML